MLKPSKPQATTESGDTDVDLRTSESEAEEFNFIMADLLRPWVAPDAYKSDDDDRASDLEK